MMKKTKHSDNKQAATMLVLLLTVFTMGLAIVFFEQARTNSTMESPWTVNDPQ